MSNLKVMALMSLALVGACAREKSPTPEDAKNAQVQEKAKIEYYTCSMHPRVRSEEPGNCPICGMTLVPVYASEPGMEGEHVHGANPVSGAVPGTVRLDEARRQWIGLRIEEIQRQPLRREIPVSARLASDPELMVAQSDYLTARRSGGGALGGLQSSLALAAKQKLLLLGMSEAEISDLQRHGRPEMGLLLPTPGQPVWIYASAFESDLPWIRPGMGAKIELPGGEQRDLVVESIAPTVDPMARTVNLRLRMNEAPPSLRLGGYLSASLQAETEAVLALPSEALLDTGTETLVFVEREPGLYEPRKIQVGRRGTKVVEVLQGLQAGEKVVTSGNFLLDSESRLRATP